MALWAVGALINVIGSILINLGTNVIKLGHTKTAALAEGPSPRLTKAPRLWWRFPGNKIWLSGMVMFSLGNVLNFSSFAFAAQSLLSALGVVQFISNIIFGRFVNKEKVTKRVLLATAVVCTGCILLVAFGNHESPTLSTHDLLELYKAPLYIAYLCFIFTVSPLMYFLYRRGKRAILTDTTGAAAKKWARWLPITYALFAGILGTQSVLYGKTISMLLRTTLSGDSQLGNWYTWVSLGLVVLFAAFWMTRYSKAMKLFPVLIIMPIIQIVWVLFSMISGSIYYQEYKSLNELSGTMFGLGVVVLLVGVWLLTGGKPPPPQPSRELKIELTEEEKARLEELDAMASRSKSPLADNLDSVLLEPEEQLVARKLSTVYERRSVSASNLSARIAAQRLAAANASGTAGRDGSWRGGGAGIGIGQRPASAPTGRGGGGGKAGSGKPTDSSISEESEVQLVEEGAFDSAAPEVPAGAGRGRAPPKPLSVVVVDNPTFEDEVPSAAAAYGQERAASPPPTTTSLMHDLRADWGVGVRDCVAAMRASVGLQQVEDDATAFSIWSMPMPMSSSFSVPTRRRSLDTYPSAYWVRSALESHHRGPAAAARSPAAAADDVFGSAGPGGSGGNTRPGHRRLNRSRSANELDDILRAAQLEQELSERTLSGSEAEMGGGDGGRYTARSHRGSVSPVIAAARHSPAASFGSAPVLSSPQVLAGSVTPSDSITSWRPVSAELQAQQGTPISPTFSQDSQRMESEGPSSSQQAPREGMLPASDFLAGLTPRGEQDLARFEDLVRRQGRTKGDKAA